MGDLRRLLLHCILGGTFVCAQLGCDGDDGGGGGGGVVQPPPPPPRSESASFASTELVFNNSLDVIWIESDLSIRGYAEKERLTVGGYWYRRSPDGDFRYVVAACPTNVPNNYLGHQFLIPVPDDDVFVNSQQYAARPFGCFSDRTGTYYGRVKLYDSKSIGINPNSRTLAVSSWVSFTWTAGLTGSAVPEVRALSAEEVRQLDLEVIDESW
jgi:hypothetical protein